MERIYWKTWLRRVLIGAVAVVLFIPLIFAAMLYEVGKLIEESR